MSDSQQEVQEAVTEFGKTFEEFKATNDKRLEEIEAKGHSDVITEEKLDRINKHLDDMEDVNQKLTKQALDAQETNERVDRLETELKRPSVGDVETKQVDELLCAYDKYLRKGRESLDEREVKVLTVSNDTGGGYLAPPEYIREIVKKVTEMSPIRPLGS